MFVLGLLFEPSLGIATFCFLMWVTLPWAFLDMLDLEKIQKRKPQADLTELDIEKARGWLAAGTLYFLGSGGIFLLAALADIISPAITSLNPHSAFSPTLLSALSFLGALSFMLYAVLRTHQVIYFLLNPTKFGQVTEFPKQAGLALREIGVIVIAPYAVMTALLLIFFIYPVAVLHELPHGPTAWVYYVLVVGYVIGLIGLYPVLRRSKNTFRKRDAIGLFMLLIPYIIAFLIVVKVLP
jgi:hypothetical protein